jgi:hypothetical protein
MIAYKEEYLQDQSFSSKSQFWTEENYESNTFVGIKKP